MIVFDLKCTNEHVFETWFRDSKTFERQRRQGQVTCPICGDGKVEKALMAPNIASSKKKDAAKAKAAAAEAMQSLANLRQHIETNCEYVGPQFAEEALKIHHGETDMRDIYGEASDTEAEELNEEGVEFARVPWLPRADS